MSKFSGKDNIIERILALNLAICKLFFSQRRQASTRKRHQLYGDIDDGLSPVPTADTLSAAVESAVGHLPQEAYSQGKKTSFQSKTCIEFFLMIFNLSSGYSISKYGRGPEGS